MGSKISKKLYKYFLSLENNIPVYHIFTEAVYVTIRFWWIYTHPREEDRFSGDEQCLLKRKILPACVEWNYIISNSFSTVLMQYQVYVPANGKHVSNKISPAWGRNVLCSHQCSQPKPNTFMFSSGLHEKGRRKNLEWRM